MGGLHSLAARLIESPPAGLRPMILDFMNGGLSYQPAAVVVNTANHPVLVLTACAVSFVGAYQQYFGAIRNGFKDRTHSIPLVGNLWFFAHDTTYVANFGHWFQHTEFWMLRAFWFALAVFAVCESVVTYQILRYSRRELFPGMTLAQALAAYAALQLFAYGLFWLFLATVTDPYYLLSFATTVVLAPMFNIAMLRWRGSRRGFSMSMMLGFVLLTSGFWLWMFAIDGFFRLPLFWLVAGGNVGMSVAGVCVFRHLPTYEPGVPTECID